MHLSEKDCSRCGICCTLFLINLTESEYKSKKYKTQFQAFGLTEDFTEAELCADNILARNEDGSCVYLSKGNCSIHASKPEACKNFSCGSQKKEFQEMIRMIDNRKKELSPVFP